MISDFENLQIVILKYLLIIKIYIQNEIIHYKRREFFTVYIH